MSEEAEIVVEESKGGITINRIIPNMVTGVCTLCGLNLHSFRY